MHSWRSKLTWIEATKYTSDQNWYFLVVFCFHLSPIIICSDYTDWAPEILYDFFVLRRLHLSCSFFSFFLFFDFRLFGWLNGWKLCTKLTFLNNGQETTKWTSEVKSLAISWKFWRTSAAWQCWMLLMNRRRKNPSRW